MADGANNNDKTGLRSVVLGVGAYLPAKTLTNADLEKMVDTTSEWIVQRTGIQERHIAAEGETTSMLGTEAAKRALANAGVEATSIDLIICATSTPDYTFPSTATQIQAALGITHGVAFDLQAVCSGFVFAVSTADKFLRSGSHKRALVIGAETFSRLLDWEDRTTCVLFGDGAGAVVLEAAAGERGILSTDLNSDGNYRDILYVDGGVSTTGTAGKLRMQGNVLFRHAVEKLAETAHRAIDKAGLTPGDIDWLVPHQANARIIAATAQRMNLPMDKVVLTVADHGNTSAASIPLALSVADRDGKLNAGDVVVTEAIGGGLSWGAVVLRW